MSNIPAADKRQTVKETSEFLKQYQDWDLIAHRAQLMAGRPLSGPQQAEHRAAVDECNKRTGALESIKQRSLIGYWVLFYRFIKGLRVKRTIDQLAAQHGINISERELYRQQRAALLSVHDLLDNAK